LRLRRIPSINAILDAMLGVGDVLTVFAQTVIVGFMPLVMLLVLLVVEHIAVAEGIRLFDKNETSVFLAAFAVVALNFCVEFWSVYVDTREQDRRRKYSVQKQKKPSLRLSLRSLAYWLGIGKKWKEQDQPPSHNFQSLQRVVTAVMLALALAGRMHTAIEKVSDAGWQAGLQKLAQESTLLDISAWVGGVLLTYATIRGAQRLTYYNAVRVVDIRQRLRDRAGKKRPDAAPIAGVQNGYNMTRLRDNTLKPKKVNGRYQCPVCQKTMTRQSWSTHPCRMVDTIIDVAIHQADETDNTLQIPDPSGSQAVVSLSGSPSVAVNGARPSVKIEGHRRTEQ
jgi:hypothetical protein